MLKLHVHIKYFLHLKNLCISFCVLNVCCSAFSPEKNNGKRGFNILVINGELLIVSKVLYSGK